MASELQPKVVLDGNVNVRAPHPVLPKSIVPGSNILPVSLPQRISSSTIATTETGATHHEPSGRNTLTGTPRKSRRSTRKHTHHLHHHHHHHHHRHKSPGKGQALTDFFSLWHLKNKEGMLRILSLILGLLETGLTGRFVGSDYCTLDTIILPFIPVYFILSVCWTAFLLFDKGLKRSLYHRAHHADRAFIITGGYLIVIVVFIFGINVDWDLHFHTKCQFEIHSKAVCPAVECGKSPFFTRCCIVIFGLLYGATLFQLACHLTFKKKHH